MKHNEIDYVDNVRSGKTALNALLRAKTDAAAAAAKTDRADPIAKTDRADPIAKTDRADPIAKTDRADPIAKTDRADPIAKTDKGRERIAEIDFTRRDLIKKIYSQYITTYETALNLSLHMERREKRRIKRIVVKSIYRDVRRARSVEKKIRWQNLPRRDKVKRIFIIISTLILLTLFIFSLI